MYFVFCAFVSFLIHTSTGHQCLFSILIFCRYKAYFNILLSIIYIQVFWYIKVRPLGIIIDIHENTK